MPLCHFVQVHIHAIPLEFHFKVDFLCKLACTFREMQCNEKNSRNAILVPMLLKKKANKRTKDSNNNNKDQSYKYYVEWIQFLDHQVSK